MTNKYIVDLSEVQLSDLELVGGKNASLGEMIQNLSKLGVNIPGGFTLTVDAYWEFISFNKLDKKIRSLIKKMKKDFNIGQSDGLRQVALDLKKFISACESKELGETDLRSASAKLYSNTKRLEKLASLVARAYKSVIPEELNNAKGDEVLAYLGIYRFPPLFPASGALIITTKNGTIASNSSAIANI